MILNYVIFIFCFFKRKTAYEMRISDWSSDVCSSDLVAGGEIAGILRVHVGGQRRAQGGRADDLGIARQARLADRPSQMGAERGRWRVAGQIGRASCRERVCQYV